MVTCNYPHRNMYEFAEKPENKTAPISLRLLTGSFLSHSFQMSQQPTRKCHKTNERDDTTNTFIYCADLILPFLTPTELASVSATCKTLHRLAKIVTLRRSSDASRSFENLPIPFINTTDHHPYAYFLYTPSQVLSVPEPPRQSWGAEPGHPPDSAICPEAEPIALVDESGESVSGCCCDGCEEAGDGGMGCPCSGSLEALGLVSECGPSCGCGLECGNRVSQRRVSVRLKIVKDGKKGWCLYSDQYIKLGQFVCEYAGELLTIKEARRRQQMYDELASGGGFSSALLVMREHLPSGKACLRINIDATRIGNVARFINHSCDGGNLSTSLVRSSGALLPRLCFFACKDIKENEELTFSYGEIRLKSQGLKCFCGSSCCFGMLPSEHT